MKPKNRKAMFAKQEKLGVYGNVANEDMFHVNNAIPTFNDYKFLKSHGLDLRPYLVYFDNKAGKSHSEKELNVLIKKHRVKNMRGN